MFSLYSIPSMDELIGLASPTPAYMRPNTTPYAVIGEGFLDVDVCDKIVESIRHEEPYEFHGCKATTREFPRPLSPVLEPVVQFAKGINDSFFGYDLDEEGAAWMQTYSAGDRYQMHTDTVPGQNRKLTAIALLSEPNSYTGGNLKLHIHPKTYTITRTKGTIMVFQPWLLHEVKEITSGVRRTINLGFWGPPFK